MRYEAIDNKLFIENRRKLAAQLKPNSVAIFFSNDIMPRGADAFHNFRQNPDLFYLTGADQEETILLMYPDAPNPDWREMLFVRETNELIAIWEGEKLNKEQARKVSGIQNIAWAHTFEKLLPGLLFQADNIYLNMNEHARYSSPSDYAEMRHIRELKAQFPLHNYERLAPIMHRMRSVKHPIEVEIMRKACEITGKGFERVLRFVKPGVMEYEIEAELWHEFIRNRSRGHAYEPIIASGANACVLHYVSNNQPCKDGDLILLDFGAEYSCYASDLSRTIPVNGRYTQRQKDVYNAVLRVHKESKKLLKPGISNVEYQKEVVKVMEKELVDLGLITMDEIRNQDPANPAYRRYFMHGNSHFLGIDVHDVGYHYEPVKEGMVFTVEPGIYIREEGIGIRIENDIVITSGDPIDLMANIPIEADHIEDIMNSR